MVSFKANTLMINGTSVTMMHKIADVAEGPDGVLVLLDYSVGLNRNVFFITPDGRLKWQIEVFSDHPDSINMSQAYSGIWNEDGKLSAFNTLGFVCEIDPASGKITKRTFTK